METKIGPLEEKSLWFLYKTQVWLEESPQRDVVHNAIRILRSIRNIGRLAYVSAPITSGKYTYELRLRHPDMNRDQMMETAIHSNYWSGWRFVDALQKRCACPVLYPADMTPVHQEWEQSHFQALWLSIIAEMSTEMHMCRGWEFSNGAAEEFVHVMQLRLGVPNHHDLFFTNTKGDESVERERMKSIQVYDHSGKPMTIDDGIRLIAKSIAWLERRNIDAPKLKNCLGLLHWTKDMLDQGFYQ